MSTLLAELRPIIHVGQGGILSWIISLLILAVVVTFVVWLVSKFAGPPNIPEPFRWIIWVVVAVVLLVVICAALGVAI
jgi:ABC-type multidrug transport system permease subunit